jgi:hypothetical protein
VTLWLPISCLCNPTLRHSRMFRHSLSLQANVSCVYSQSALTAAVGAVRWTQHACCDVVTTCTHRKPRAPCVTARHSKESDQTAMRPISARDRQPLSPQCKPRINNAAGARRAESPRTPRLAPQEREPSDPDASQCVAPRPPNTQRRRRACPLMQGTLRSQKAIAGHIAGRAKTACSSGVCGGRSSAVLNRTAPAAA